MSNEKRIDIYLWNRIFRSLDHDSQINLMLTSSYLSQLRFKMKYFYRSKYRKSKVDIDSVYPNIKRLTDTDGDTIFCNIGARKNKSFFIRRVCSKL